MLHHYGNIYIFFKQMNHSGPIFPLSKFATFAVLETKTKFCGSEHATHDFIQMYPQVVQIEKVKQFHLDLKKTHSLKTSSLRCLDSHHEICPLAPLTCTCKKTSKTKRDEWGSSKLANLRGNKWDQLRDNDPHNPWNVHEGTQWHDATKRRLQNQQNKCCFHEKIIKLHHAHF